MPDLTIEYFEICADLDGIKYYDVGGYEQTLYNGSIPHDACTCPAYKFSKTKTCKHLTEAYKIQCQWHGAHDEPQEEKKICPRCGGPTVTIRMGV